jgi:DNA repair protein RAD16
MHYCGMPDCGEKVEPEDAATSKCKHIFHRECIQPYLEIDFGADGIKCPKCRTNLTIDLFPDAEAIDKIKAPKDERGGGVKKKGKGELDADDVVPNKSILNQIDLSEYRTSSKIEKMMEKLREIRSGRDGKKNKAIIFSQYTSMIDIVEWRMRKENFVIRKLVGSMPVTARAQNLHEFCTDPDVDAIIMSLKSGGEGLNLQAANYVFVLEPWWNPAVEMQAVMRAHRIGQTREVTAFRFACKDTIESKMHELQKLKRLVFEGTMDGNEASMAKLSPEDLQFLFKR